MSENISDGASLDASAVASILENTSGRGKLYPAPAGVAGWSWGGFAFSWIWAVFNGTWLGLLALIPGVGLIVRVMLGMKGREWAWQNKRWDSVEHFNRVQRKWSMWSIVFLGIPLLGIVAAIAIPAYQNYVLREPVAAAFNYANEATQAVSQYTVSHHALPRHLGDVHLAAPRPSSIQYVIVDPLTGRLTVTLAVGHLRGRSFYLVPVLGAYGRPTWRCLHGDVPRHFLPADCKYDTAGSFSP
jgi:hypothetical protein